MTRRYEHPIRVKLADDGSPAQLRWRGTEYRVRMVLAQWRLRDRLRAGWDTNGPSDRRYYRLDCGADMLCDVYYDTTSDQWVLEVVHD